MLFRYRICYYLLLISFTACAQEPGRPNIILINVDDVGYGDFGAYGQQLIRTPRIDELAAQGRRFVNFYAAAPVCGPSRAALLTARHGGRLGSCGNSQANLSADFSLWPQNLRAAGYHTGLFGKQHAAILSGESVNGDSPVDRGFDEFLGWLNAVDAHQFYLDGQTVTPGWQRRNYLFRNNEEGGVERYDIASDRYVQDEFIAGALDFITRHQDSAFMLYLPFTLAHAELAVPGTAYPAITAEDSLLLGQYLDENGSSLFPEFDYQGDGIYGRPNPFKTRATLAAMISRLDRDVGRIIDLLENLNLRENTIVVLTSDNGPHDEGGVDENQIDGLLESPFNSTGGLRGLKRSLYEGGIRVPMIVSWPGTVLPGIDSSLHYQPDLGPTFLEIASAEPIEATDGLSMLSTLLGGEEPVHHELYWQFGSQQALRRGNFKVYRGSNTSANDPVELYDLSVDAAETNDLAENPAYVTILDTLRHKLNDYNAGSACAFIPLAANDGPGPRPSPAWEPFDYPGGGLDGKGGAESGWAGAWERVVGFNHGLRGGGISAQLEGSGEATTSNNRIKLNFTDASQNARFLRPLKERYPDDGSVYWLGFWWDAQVFASGNVGQVLLLSTETFSPAGPGGQLMRLGKDFNGELIGFNEGPYSTFPVEEGHFVVARIATSGNTAPDTVSLYLNPSPTVNPSGRPPDAEKLIALNAGFDALGFKVEGTSGLTVDLDELRLGLSYEDVVPEDLTLVSVARVEASAPLRVYPNPASDKVYLDGLNLAPATIKIHNRNGELVREWMRRGSGWLSVRDVPAGMYFLSVVSSATATGIRLIVAR